MGRNATHVVGFMDGMKWFFGALMRFWLDWLMKPLLLAVVVCAWLPLKRDLDRPTGF